MDDSEWRRELAIKDNRYYLEQCRKHGADHVLIEDDDEIPEGIFDEN